MKYVLTAAVILSAILPVAAKWENVAGEWEKYRLDENQMKWFSTVRSVHKVPCCSIADGHPTDSEERPDGYYVPNPRDLTGPWIKVPPEAYTTPSNNPVGTAVVWYTSNGSDSVTIRCFVPESKV